MKDVKGIKIFERILTALLRYRHIAAVMAVIMLMGSPINVVYASPKQDTEKSFTLLIYMNGSDLESRYKLATYNISEMLAAKPENDSFNVIILAGGTNDWDNANIKDKSVTYLRLDKNGLKQLKEVSKRSMGESSTLSEFIAYAVKTAPADKYGIVFWNHGAGSVRGFGVDELFDRDSLTVSEIRDGLSDGLNGEVFSFIGFDACLMATAEVADACAPFAEYMIASQELEPGEGWDYKTIFSKLAKEPAIETTALGKVIVDSFIKLSVEKNPNAQATLSLIDLNKIRFVTRALGDVAENITGGEEISNFSEISTARNNTKSFGAPSLNNTGMDMIDIADFAKQVKNLSPSLASSLTKAVENAVVYSKTSDNVYNANGLSVYFPYKNKSQLNSLASYFESGFNSSYLSMVGQVAERLKTGKYEPAKAPVVDSDDDSVSMLLNSVDISNIVDIYAVLVREGSEGLMMLGMDSDIEFDEKTGKINADFNRDWVSINGVSVAVYTIMHDEEVIMYSVPALLNGSEVELIIIYDDENPYGAVLGARRINDVPDKGYVPIGDGDKITFLYELYDVQDKTETGVKVKGETITRDGELIVDVTPVPDGKYYYGFCMLDIYQNRLYSKFVPLEY